MKISRRKTLKIAAGAAVSPLLSGLAGQLVSAVAQPAVDAPLTQAEIDALDVMVAEQGAKSSAFTFEDFLLDKDLRLKLVRTRVVPALEGARLSKSGVRLAAVAVTDKDSPNYNHLQAPISKDIFKLNAGVLERMAEASRFTGSFDGLAGNKAQKRIIIFGLRGCSLAPGAIAGAMSDEISLVEAPIDHMSKNCVMGVWDRITRKVSAFTASTAPHLLYMQMYRINLHLLKRITLDDATVGPDDKISDAEMAKRELPWTANMLGQGLHMMNVGKHQGKYPNLLVQHPNWYGPVLRASRSLAYTVNDWDRTKTPVGDNIHPCWPVPTWQMGFASAGCNLIEGEGKTGPDYDGPFGTFLKQIKKPADDRGGIEGSWKSYFYMLLSGREARLHAKSTSLDPALKRMRFGSSGPEVVSFQKTALGMNATAADGVFGFGTHGRVLTLQADLGFPTDGVVTPKLLAAI